MTVHMNKIIHVREKKQFNSKLMISILTKVFYPKLMPPPVMSPNCNKSVCRFCCLNSKSKMLLNAK